ncbi:hypothetical protein NLX71_24790 [Paenibacillus sp. MZ04-78.2]|uniref:hypothetical protein n=1 Tax=Paenibacillus sp. MZ04-78.2 TaxID=2962034 RepID=UPI0020B742AF|nr:hypothetical protein [Paenibacillus sp. MZ04-78.2]MCP3776467.1 hypothetical protein [Paenibacillus sp. MZ04-78.2]
MKTKKILVYTIVASTIFGVSVYAGSKIKLVEPVKAESTNKAVSLEANAAAIKNISKINDKILITNQTYSSLEGKISTTYHTTGEQEVIELVIEQPGKFYAKQILDSKNPSYFVEAVNDGEEVQVKESDSSEVQTSLPPNKSDAKAIYETNNAITPDYNGTYLPIGGVNELLHPEMFIQGAFTRGNVTVKGIEKYLERETTVVSLDYPKGKLGNKHTFSIDNQTGIILKLVSSEDDKPIQTITFEQIKFSDKIDGVKFKKFK